MGELIEQKKIISAEQTEQVIIKALVDCMIKHKGLHEVSDAVLDALHNIPAVDAMPVVRCKDCIHSEAAIPFPAGILYCNINDAPFSEYGYCNRGKRRENAE